MSNPLERAEKAERERDKLMALRMGLTAEYAEAFCQGRREMREELRLAVKDYRRRLLASRREAKKQEGGG